jgi:tetratricopeptide (TPR) repeat protein
MRAAGVTAIAPLVVVSLGLMGSVGYRDLTVLHSAGEQSAPPVTYTKDVAPILFEHCAGCHNPYGSAPFSVLEFEAVRTRGRDIVAATESRAMPPWLPEPGYGEFAGNRRLTTDQIETIRAWVEQGMPEGNRANRPPAPGPADGWQLGEPDLIVTMPVPYTLPAGNTDIFRNFVIPIPVSETRFVKTIELRPGSARFVHHALMAIDETPSSRRLDDQEPGLGFAGMDLMGEAHMPDGSLLGWTPGMLPFPGIAGMTWRLQPRTDLVLQLHMLPSDTPQTIQAAVGIHFAEPSEPPAPAHVLLLDADDQLNIPAGDKKFVVTDSMELPVDVEVLLVYPHAHYLGKSVEGWATLPDGTTRWLIKIDHWNFMWQDMYRYVEPVPLPAGTTVSMRWTFDNSAENPSQRYDPPRPVTAGNRSTNEMAHLQLQMRLRRSEDRPMLQEAQYAHVVRRNPGNARLRYGLASALKDQRRFAEAAREYRATLAIDPDYFAAHLNLGAVLMMQAIPVRLDVDASQRPPWPQADEAIAHLRAAVRLDPDSAGAHYNLGIAFVYQGQLDEAARQYREAIRSNRDYAEAHNNLGQVLTAQGQLDDAIQHLREAERLMPDSADIPNNLGIALWRQGKTEEAISSFRRALELDPGHQGARQNLDIALKAAGSAVQRP